LTFAVRQNWSALNIMGEPCYLLKRLARSNATFHYDGRRVSTITQTASSFSVDPDTGYLRYTIWQDGVDPIDEYPDIGTLTATVQASGSGPTSVWEAAVDKYSFISNREEYAFDIFRNQIDSDGNAIDDAVYIVFNTPPFTLNGVAILNFGTISPATDFDRLQPDVSNETGFQTSLFGFDQWLDLTARIRRRVAPHQFLLAFPGVAQDIVVGDGGYVQERRTSWWTTPPPYSPLIMEHDIIIRKLTGARFQVVNRTPIYIENILCSQHFDLSETDPRSEIYNVPYVTG
jgi:hypothetical protein